MKGDDPKALAALTVACPACKVGAGQPCLTSKGGRQRAGVVHTGRLWAADAQGPDPTTDTCGSCGQVVGLHRGVFLEHRRQSTVGTSPRCAGSGGSMGDCRTCAGAGISGPVGESGGPPQCPYCRGTGRTLRRGR